MTQAMTIHRGTRIRRAIALALMLVALAATAACGTKSRPELPEGQSDQYPRQYPNPNEP
jgi:predicted small lipoprotein YifL